MTETIDQMQKMLSGQDYDPLCPQLSNQRKRAKALCFEYNHCHPDQKGKRQQILSKLFNSSKKAIIEPNFYCDYGYNIDLGSNFYANHNCTILDSAKVSIGDNVMLGPGVTLATASHPLQPEERLLDLGKALPITIENNVWIGMGAQILPGVTIGKDSVVAAGAVVAKDVPPATLVAGVPAKVIRALN